MSRQPPGAWPAILNLDSGELLAKMKDPARQTFMVVKHRINPQDEGRIEALGIDGIYLMEESMRVYPNRELGAQTLGFVNMNGDGGAGIEQYYDRELKGTQGQISFDVDARRRAFRAKVEQRPVQGHSLVLSIDKDIQYITERELAAGVENSRAAGGIAIVMESDTGRILALAGYPAFNCNTYNEYALGRHRNRAVSDIFEPGSTFKVVVAAAALDAGLTRPSESIDCLMGAITIAGHVFHDHKPYGLLTFSEILEKSSNVGAARLGLRLGRKRLYEALADFRLRRQDRDGLARGGGRAGAGLEAVVRPVHRGDLLRPGSGCHLDSDSVRDQCHRQWRLPRPSLRRGPHHR